MRRTYEISDTRAATCSPERIVQVLRDPKTWPEWQSEIVTTSGSSPLHSGDEVEGRAQLLGFEVDGRSRTIEANRASFVEDVIVGVRMRVEYDVRPGPDGATVTRRLTAYLPGGISGRVLSFFLTRRLRAMQKGVLEALVAQAEGV